jgi:hypothetical protein
MFRSRSRCITASALLAGCLCLPLATPAAFAARSAGAGQSTVAGAGLFGSFWSLLVSLWTGDDDHADTYHGGHHHGSGSGDSPEGPGMCPHGGH